MSVVLDRLRGAVDVTRFLKLPRSVKETAKGAMAAAFDASGLSGALHRVQVAALSPFIRAVNYHDVAPADAATFESHLVYLKERFRPIGYEELIAFHEERLSLDRPGVIVSFDDGLRSHAEVAAPLLERHGIPGWFFVPTGFVDTPPEHHAAFGRSHRISWSAEPVGCPGAMSWAQVRELDRRGHVVGCHTHSHVRLSNALGPAELREEIAESKARLERELGHGVDVFCWVGGEESSYSEGAARAIRDAGYRVSFMNAKSVIKPSTSLLQLHRCALEASRPLSYVRYRLSGFFDVAYAAQRHRVNRLTG